MERYLYFVAAFFIEALILLQYCETSFISRRPAYVKYPVLFALYGILTISFSFNSIALNGFLFFLANFLFIFEIYRVSILNSLFHSILTTIIMSLSELLVLSFFPNLAYRYYEDEMFIHNFVLLTVGSKLIYFLLLYALSGLLTKQRDSSNISKKESFILLIIPSISIWIFYSLIIICREIELVPWMSHLIFISSFLLLIINIVVWGIYRFLLKRGQSFTNLQLQLQKELYSAEHYATVLKHNEEQQLLIHDIKKHLYSISLLNEQKQYEEVTKYLEELQDSAVFKSSYTYCDHGLLNAIFCHYANLCNENKIDFQVEVRSGVLDFMSSEHLTSLFCNLLDNAIESSRKKEGGYIQIKVSKQLERDFSLITVNNSCVEAPIIINGNYISAKKNREQHGFGLKNVRRIVEFYEGEVKLFYEEKEQKFTSVILLRKEHGK